MNLQHCSTVSKFHLGANINCIYKDSLLWVSQMKVASILIALSTSISALVVPYSFPRAPYRQPTQATGQFMCSRGQKYEVMMSNFVKVAVYPRAYPNNNCYVLLKPFLECTMQYTCHRVKANLNRIAQSRVQLSTGDQRQFLHQLNAATKLSCNNIAAAKNC